MFVRGCLPGANLFVSAFSPPYFLLIRVRFTWIHENLLLTAWFHCELYAIERVRWWQPVQKKAISTRQPMVKRTNCVGVRREKSNFACCSARTILKRQQKKLLFSCNSRLNDVVRKRSVWNTPRSIFVSVDFSVSVNFQIHIHIHIGELNVRRLKLDFHRFHPIYTT